MLVFIAAAIITYIKYPDWMWMYYLDHSYVNLYYLVIISILIYIFPYIAGFLIQRRLYEIQKGFEIIFFVLAIAVQILLFLSVKERYMKVGTYAEFHGGTTIPIMESPLARILSLFSIALITLIIVLWIYSKKKS